VRRALIPLLIAVTALFALASLSEVSEGEAKSLFNSLGCTGCHNGAVAPSWDDLVREITEAGARYGGDLDAYARSIQYTLNPSIKFNSWQDLKKVMAQNVGKQPSDPGVSKVFEYLESLAAQATTATPTPTLAPTTPSPSVNPLVGVREALTIALIINVLIIAALYYSTRE